MAEELDQKTAQDRKDQERRESEDRERAEAHRRAQIATGAAMVILFGE